MFELDKNDYKNWAIGLKTAGYATNPKYPDLLIGVIIGFTPNKARVRYTRSAYDTGQNIQRIRFLNTRKMIER